MRFWMSMMMICYSPLRCSLPYYTLSFAIYIPFPMYILLSHVFASTKFSQQMEI